MVDCKFWKRINKTKTCWLWTGPICIAKGAAVIHRTVDGNRIALTVANWSWRLKYGDIAKGKVVLHRCENKLCVRPAHLYLGGRKEQYIKAQISAGSHTKGETHAAAKFTQKQVATFRKAFAGGERPTHIARRTGNNIVTIWNIVHRINDCYPD